MKELQLRLHHVAKSHGFWNGVVNVPEKLALVHSEISEALEEYRSGVNLAKITISEKGKPEGFPVELADAIIRILDIAEYYGIDMGAVIEQKSKYNETRTFRHGGKLA